MSYEIALGMLPAIALPQSLCPRRRKRMKGKTCIALLNTGGRAERLPTWG